MNVKTKGFALDLADLLEKHSICITAPNTDPENKIFSYVNFIARGRSESLMPKLQRCHVSSYDLRCETGMSSSEANELYQSNKQDYIDALKPKANKPIYTPKPDERCFYNFMDSTGWISCIFMGECNGTIWVISNGKHEHHKLVDMEFKPLTPPIKLKDGKAYQFDVRDKGGVVFGIYHEYDKKLHVGPTHYFGLMSATNIKPLTVKGEE